MGRSGEGANRIRRLFELIRENDGTMTTTELRERTELERIEDWRRERLEAAGYPSTAAARLAARHDVDLHRALELVDRGCPPETALEILL